MHDRERALRAFLFSRIFDPILHSDSASEHLKYGIRNTIQRLEGQDADDIIRYIHWLTEHGSDTSGTFAAQMQAEGFTRFEDIRHELDLRFNRLWQHRS
jgi:hypothetical protein